MEKSINVTQSMCCLLECFVITRRWGNGMKNILAVSKKCVCKCACLRTQSPVFVFAAGWGWGGP